MLRISEMNRLARESVELVGVDGIPDKGFLFFFSSMLAKVRLTD